MNEIQDIHVPFRAWLHDRGIPYVYHRPDRKSGIHKGHPDFSILFMRRNIMIECKTPGGKLSQDQVKRIDFLRRSGNVVVIARSLSECVEACYDVLLEGRRTGETPASGDWPLKRQFKELKDAVGAVGARLPGNENKFVPTAVEQPRHATSDSGAKRLTNCNGQSSENSFAIATWNGTDYVMARRKNGTYDMIRQATAADIINHPPLVL